MQQTVDYGRGIKNLNQDALHTEHIMNRTDPNLMFNNDGSGKVGLNKSNITRSPNFKRESNTPESHYHQSVQSSARSSRSSKMRTQSQNEHEKL